MEESDTRIGQDEVRRGAIALFFIQLFSTLSYSILYSTLTLYGTEKLHLSTTDTLAITGSFLAFNYGLHFLGGYLGGRYISNRLLFVSGMLLQVMASFVLAMGTLQSLMVGLAVFLTGSGLNVTCLNSMLTQLFQNESHQKREKAFLWNYSGMNIGFFVGFSLSGILQGRDAFAMLFMFGGVANFITIILVFLRWHTLRDRDTFLNELPKNRRKKPLALAYGFIGLVLFALLILMRHAKVSDVLIIIIALGMVGLTFYLALSRKVAFERSRMMAFICFLVANVVFWTLYQLAPEGLIIFIEHNVNRSIGGYLIAPQWFSNINTIVIVLGGPGMAWLLPRLRERGYKISIPCLFANAMLLIGLGILLIPAGIHYADPNTGLVAFGWIVVSYILQSIAELCISPIGYAAIGKLIPNKYQNMMMGLWCMMTGVAAIFASKLSDMALGTGDIANPHVTNPTFFRTFSGIGAIVVVCGVVMLFLIPRFYRMINENPEGAVN